MMTKDEALTLALEALTYCEALNRPVQEQKMHAITAIKEALAQPEQDAAAFIAAENRKVASRYGYVPKLHPSEWQDAQSEQEPVGFAVMERPWVGLTGQEKALVASVSLGVHDAVHRTDAKLKEKNT